MEAQRLSLLCIRSCKFYFLCITVTIYSSLHCLQADRLDHHPKRCGYVCLLWLLSLESTVLISENSFSSGYELIFFFKNLGYRTNMDLDTYFLLAKLRSFAEVFKRYLKYVFNWPSCSVCTVAYKGSVGYRVILLQKFLSPFTFSLYFFIPVGILLL